MPNTNRTQAPRSRGPLPDLVKNFIEKRIQDASFDLPMLPGVASEAMALCSSDDADAAKIASLLHRDPTITGRVMRLVNSPLFGSKTEIVSLQQAISRLGLNQLVEIVVGVAVGGRLFNSGNRTELLGRIWRHSAATGFLCKEVARLRRRNVESLFLCGLLHDIGKAVLLEALDYEMDFELPQADLHLAMDRYHAQVGGLLAKQWRLPAQVIESVRYHHDYDKAEAYREAAMTVNFCDTVAHAMFPTEDTIVRQSDVEQAEVREHLNLYPDDVEKLFEKEDLIEQMLEALA